MNASNLTIAEQLAELATEMQRKRTGHAPKAVTVVFSDDTLVLTLHEALTPAERDLAQTTSGAAQVQEFHQQLFASSTAEMRESIKRITGRDVREAAVEIETSSGTVFHAFTSGRMVQLFMLTPAETSSAAEENASN